MARRRTNYDSRLSVLVEIELWYKLEAFSRFRQLDGKSTIVRHAVREYLNGMIAKMDESERRLFDQILANIKQPATIEEITK